MKEKSGRKNIPSELSVDGVNCGGQRKGDEKENENDNEKRISFAWTCYREMKCKIANG